MLPYLDFPKKEDIINHLNKFDWDKPWNAGAQFISILCFCKYKLNENERIDAINSLVKYINNKVNEGTSGLYFENKLPNSVESINGAMKVLTGFEWLSSKIHYHSRLLTIV